MSDQPDDPARAVVYPERYDEYGRSRDNLGRVLPSRLNWMSFLRACPWLVRYFDRDLPAAAQASDVDEQGVPVVIVACPCGAEPKVRLARCVECPGEGCGRFYLNAGSRVLVANSPHSPHRVEVGEYRD